MAKSLMANMIKNRHASVKANAPKNKKLVADNRKATKTQPMEQVLEEKSVMKEPKTLMLD